MCVGTSVYIYTNTRRNQSYFHYNSLSFSEDKHLIYYLLVFEM